ncbi:MAG TPA: serine/threonine-protein kinase [Ktedonobacteraceae bacterium]
MATTRGQHLLGKEIGSCVLERLLGYGGSSAVFLARSLTSGNEVAVKVFLPRSTLDGAMRKSFYQRFLREAEAASHVEHPHILSIYAYGEHEGLPYIVMPYLSGGTLSEYVQQHGPLSLDEARRYLTQIASALDYAHTEGYVHCDVKPANILLDGQGHAALSDFGIVRWQQAEQPEEDGAKRSGAETLMGTPDYVSPEQALGEALDGRSDIYSLGATLYALLTGAPPFKADTPIALALMHVHEAPTPVGLLRADVTPQIDFVVAKALAKWPEERFQTAGAFALAFGLAVSEAGESAQFSLKHARLAKLEVANPRTPVPLTVLTAGAEPVVQIKPISPTQQRFNFWRGGLLFTLVALLLLACLLTALFIGALKAAHSRVAGTTPTVSFPHGPLDDTENWPQSSTFFFRQHTYVIQNVAPQGGPALAFYANHTYTNFRLQVTSAEIKGTFNGADYYGVAFRASTDQSRYYLFDVSAWGGGLYDFLRYDGGDHWTTLVAGQIPLFQTAAGRQNTLTVVVRDTVFLLYLNGRQVGQPVVDHSSKIRLSGEIGLVVEEPRTEVAFSGLLLTTL